MKQAWRSFGGGAALILLLTLVAYLPALRGGFIWDDDAYVTENQALRSPDGLGKIWLKPGTTPQYYPMVFTSFWVEYHLWRLQPFGYHLVNVLLHAANAVLLWSVLRRLGIPGSWWAAAIFALHPVMVESVAWVTERKNVLSGLFYLLAALAYFRFRPLADGKAIKARNWQFYPLVLLLFLCALLSKTATCSLPAALALLVWWKNGRIEKRDAVALAPLFGLGAVLGFMTAWLEKYHVHASGTEWALSLAQRCLLAGRALWFYAGKLFWPDKLTFIYPRWEIDAGAAWSYLFPLGALAVLITLWLLRPRLGKGPLVAVLFFAGTLVPALGFFDVFPFRYSYVADHFQYLASIGLIAVFAAAISNRMVMWQVDRTTQCALSFSILLALGTLTWQRAGVYRDAETLWCDTLTKNPSCWMAHTNLGITLDAQGRVREAMEHYELALRLKPDDAATRYDLGNALVEVGKTTEAIGQYEQSLRLKPVQAEVHNNLGIALVQAERAPEAIGHYQEALRLKPDYVEAHNNLASALAALGRFPEAIAHWEQALRLKPEYAKVHYNLAVALEQTGKLNEAVGHYEEALRLRPDLAKGHKNLGYALLRQGRAEQAAGHLEQWLRTKPDDADAYSKLGVALFQTGKIRDAIGQYEEALRLKPDLIGAQNNLAWLLATVAASEGGDPVRAVGLSERVCELTENRVASYVDTLGVAYAAAGRFGDAIAAARRAVELAGSAGQLELAGEIKARLQLYRDGRAYRQPMDAPGPHAP